MNFFIVLSNGYVKHKLGTAPAIQLMTEEYVITTTIIERIKWEYIIFPVALGSIVLVIIAWTFYKLPPQTIYPLPENTSAI